MMSIGLLAELITDLLGRERDHYSIAEETGVRGQASGASESMQEPRLP
jgi:hypothetical protein